ncbi:DNA replication licensing factor MCM7 [Raphidocelis subcapitata]|uniref:DNA helicase n=1 Tax=Raphidocelis subcapitata TaxID=307507 RepID=A0A2V0P894_9CHLO|nr:DNA replication licensing factor MCM7 [Raphidocelis subcapitata]|eukprot:GBF93305.1 DNA replication licensing factor MCM7 [Raphidocelis subcapitata]
MAANAESDRTSWDEEKGVLHSFLLNFQSADESGKLVNKYMRTLQAIANRECKLLNVYLDDLRDYLAEVDPARQRLLEDIQSNTMRYVGIVAEAADDAMPPPEGLPQADIFDRLLESRSERLEHMRAQGGGNSGLVDTSTAGVDAAKAGRLPAALTRRYDVFFVPEERIPIPEEDLDPSSKERTAPCPVTRMRGVNAALIGKLVRVKGVVTHVTDVKPLASVITYTDEESGSELYQEVLGRTFVPIEAQKKPDGGKWVVAPTMQTKGSKFIKFQEARLQESADEVPEGATPRTLSLHLRGEVTRSLKAGDNVVLAGVFLPEPFSGWKAMRAGLLTSTYLEVMHVTQAKAGYADMTITQDQIDAINALGAQGNVFERLAASIAPEIYGMREVKKALLLQMVGGVTRSFPDGMKLRGDIHICLMGDPGVAKSQLLKHVAKVAPRAVYTTGKGSSGVGLTAAVLRNQVTKELVLEGGALVLADRGICCIDEFDKMEEGDRTNIHEVMEQQTVSIAKAGITTTLNTRTTILAAANPAFGRWNLKRSPGDNINMPPALLSRFDLMWLLLDKQDLEQDRRLAQHILSVHQGVVAKDDSVGDLVAPELLRAYISLSRRQAPYVPPELSDYVVAHYCALRQRERDDMDGRSYVTPRTLLSILRLAQAVAKLRFDEEVSRSDVDAALALMTNSQASITPDIERRVRDDPISRVYQAVRTHALRTRQAEVSVETIRQLVAFDREINKDAAIEQCVREYEGIAVWAVTRDATTGAIASVRFPEEDIALAL